VTLANLISELLKAHAESLHALASILGEEALLELLEKTAQNYNSNPVDFDPDPEWFMIEPNSSESAFFEIEEAAQSLKLSFHLEFYLWNYPFYRALIESPIHPQSKLLSSSKAPGAEILVEETIKHAQQYIRRLPIPAALRSQVNSEAFAPWLRFRTQAFKKLGKKPFTSLR
jgi:hypothetical protein